MNGPGWEDRLGEWLRTTPPEVDAVDYAAIREAARREAKRRVFRRNLWTALAVAAAVLLALRLPLHREVPRPAVARVAPKRPAVEVAKAAPAVSPAVRPAVLPRPRRRKKAPDDLDRRFAEFLRAQSPTPSAGPVVISTDNPNVSIILVRSNNGEDNE